MPPWVALTLAISCLTGDGRDGASAPAQASCCESSPQGQIPSPAGSAAGNQPAPTSAAVGEQCCRQQGWWITQTENFRVCSLVGYQESTRIARHCEALRLSIRKLWLPAHADLAWTPRCDVIAHRSDAGYIQAVGRGGAQTAGSALIEIGKGQVLVRRIDLRLATREALESALAHEMTHVILADRFTDKVLPRWADEGMATLADSRAKQELHWRDLRRGLQARSTLPVTELVTLDRYPAPRQMAVFYGQSVSLVSFLLSRGEPGQFVRFVETAIERGYDRALAEVYQIAGIRELERRWLESLRGGAAEFVSRTPRDFPVITAANTAPRGT